MANMELITSVTVGAGGTSSVTLPATGTIPQTYTDLKVVYSARSNAADYSDDLKVLLNGSTASVYNNRVIKGTGSTTINQSSSNTNVPFIGMVSGATATSSTFSNGEMYFPNYTSTSNAKSMSSDAVSENNATNAMVTLGAYFWNPATQAAITTIAISPYNGTAFLEGSTFYLYGISAVPSSPKATGGIVSQDATYWYHTFPFSSTFTPTQALSADVLVIAGGGSGGSGVNTVGGGGGAGGLRAFTSQSLTTTAYTCTVGAGGASNTNGANSSFAGSGFTTINATGGGKGGISNTVGSSGGSGGGGGTYPGGAGTENAGGSGNAGSYSPVEGYAGGSSKENAGNPPRDGGGGGGAGGAGGNGRVGNAGGAGGIGATSSFITSIVTATGIGQLISSSGYLAGGGGGAATGTDTIGIGGFGGGGNGNKDGGASSENGLVNTGSGGGGYVSAGNSNGGSGIVVIRYAK